MLDYGFSQYESVQLCNDEELLFPLPVVGGADAYVMLVNTEALRVTLPRDHGEIKLTIEAPHFAYAPIAEGETVGLAIYRCDINGDGSINAADATQIKRYYNNKNSVFASLTGEELTYLVKAADVNNDGKANASDATQIKRYYNNKTSVFANIE